MRPDKIFPKDFKFIFGNKIDFYISKFSKFSK